MLQLVVSTFLAFAVLQSAQADDTYVYKFKSTQFYADMVIQMENRINSRIVDFEKTMEENNNFVKVAQEYKDLLETASRSIYKAHCSIPSNMDKLTLINATYQKSLPECRNQADCRTDLPETTARIVQTIQGFDTDAFNQASACADDACKLKVYDSTHEKLFKLYQDSMPQLRVTVDQAVSNNKCYSSIIKCMVDKNSDGLKQMYLGIANVENCMSSRGIHGNKISSILGGVSAHRPLGSWYN